jgi:hypothetical protein
MELTTKKRNSLPDEDFAVKGRKYPVEDKKHADNALSRVAANGTPTEKKEVRSKVAKKFPTIQISGSKRTSRRKNARKALKR